MKNFGEIYRVSQRRSREKKCVLAGLYSYKLPKVISVNYMSFCLVSIQKS